MVDNSLWVTEGNPLPRSGNRIKPWVTKRSEGTHGNVAQKAGATAVAKHSLVGVATAVAPSFWVICPWVPSLCSVTHGLILLPLRVRGFPSVTHRAAAP